jgi:Flp pilus assembly CpaF family ATPase
MNPDRVIVGEVLGDEIVDMLNAMSQGNDGSLSTIHANSASEVFGRIATYALQAPEHLTEETIARMTAGALHFVVFLAKHGDNTGLRRFVTSIREVNGLDGQILSSEVFAPGPDGRAAPAHQISCLSDLLTAGYQVAPAPAGSYR